jgi:hypothetical protein
MSSSTPDVTLPSGTRLTKAVELGGLDLTYHGSLIGWVHQKGDVWAAYLRQPDEPLGMKVGTLPLKDAVASILQAHRARIGLF